MGANTTGWRASHPAARFPFASHQPWVRRAWCGDARLLGRSARGRRTSCSRLQATQAHGALA